VASNETQAQPVLVLNRDIALQVGGIPGVDRCVNIYDFYPKLQAQALARYVLAPVVVSHSAKYN
jgi:hypothetical protein